MDLVILAAGMGSRFGGLKQIEPMGPNGEFIIDYSIFDAIRNGFNRVIFIIKEENYDIFRETIGKRIEEKIKVEYVFQKLSDIPEDVKIPEGREKPWGTAHALYACRHIIKDNFLIINGDDFYGQDAYVKGAEFLKKIAKKNIFKKLFCRKAEFALIAYKAKNTLTDNGAAKRGVCDIKNDRLMGITESSVEKIKNKYYATPLDTTNTKEISGDTYVSMNMWCLTPYILKYMEKDFPKFIRENIEKNPLKCEYFLPILIDEMSKKHKANIHVLYTKAKWCGVTYKADKPLVVKELRDLTKKKKYPAKLWE